MKWYDRDLEIRYADTDQMGVVHHAVHPVYCELSRLHIMDCLGLPYAEIEQAGYYLMVHKLTLRYHAPARFGQRIYVRGAIARLNKRLIEFQYEIRDRTDDHLICSGETTHMVSLKTGALASLPRPIMAVLEGAVG